MSVLCKEPPAKPFYSGYTPSKQMLKRLNGLNKNTSLHWKLSEEELYYIQNNYPTYKVTPSVYAIKTALNFKNSSNASGIIKKLNNGAKKGKSFIRSSLKKSEIDLLNQLGIYYKPVKFLITSL